MPKAKQISLNNTLIDIGDGNCEIWDVTESSGTYSITGHSTPYADITTALNNNTSVVLRHPDGRLFYLAGNFGTGNEARYSFTYNEATTRMIIGIYSNNTITYTTPTGGAPRYHRSTDTTYGIGSENYYGHNKVINNLTTASYTEGESLSAYQGKVLKDGINAVTPTLPSVAAVGKSNQSVTSATDTNMGSFTLTAGLWLVVVTARWNVNATGVRQVWLASSSTGSALNYSSVVSHQGANGAITSEQLTVFLNVTSQTTYYIVVRQSSGSALTCNTQYSTCRLGNA